MKILSIDTSSSICSVTILEDRKVIKHLELNDKKSHSENLMPMIKNLFCATKLKLQDMDLLCCNKGPRFFYRN